MSLSRLLYSVNNLGYTFNSLKGMLNRIKKPKNNNTPEQKTPQSTNTDDAVAELTLVVDTIVSLLIDKGIITEEDFKTKFNELDMQDGVQDGKLTK